MTQVALRTHKKDMMQEEPTFSKQKFLYRLSRSDYEKNWGKEYSKPGPGARVLSVFFHYLPKVGPFKAMAFKSPTPQTAEMYFKSINTAVDQYRAYLEAVRTDSLQLADVDFDTGKVTRPAEYSLTDNAYAKLLGKLSERHFDRTSPELRANIVNFYGDLSAPIETKKDTANWQALQTSLDQLKSATLVPTLANQPSVVPGPAQAPTAIAGKHHD
jgi:hypothetical protein